MFLFLNIQCIFPILVKEIELKSSTAERAVIDLIEKFLSVIDQPELQEKKLDWLDPDKAIKPIGSASRLNVSPEAGDLPEINRSEIKY